MFKNVIVRTPSKSICDGITSAPELGKPIYEKALEQHKGYIETLKKCGVEVEVLEPLDEFPDSCFVEDVAVLTKNCAIISRGEDRVYKRAWNFRWWRCDDGRKSLLCGKIC